MKKIYLFLFFSLNILFANSQCTPDPNVVALGDPEGDGVLNPWVLEVHPGEEVNVGVTVLAPPSGVGVVSGFTVPYTMNHFTVTSLDNQPSWVSYECPNNCKFLVNVYSCVQVTGTVPNDVIVGDSVVMDVIVDANVDAVVLGVPINGYDVTGENGGTLTIRYVAPSSITEEIATIKATYNSFSQQINVENASEYKVVNIYNMMGEKIISTNQNIINISSYSKGIYIVEILDGEKRIIDKVMKY